MKQFSLFVFALIALTSSAAFARDKDQDRERLSESLVGIEKLEEQFFKFLAPIRREEGESEKVYLKRAERILKGRAFYVHLLHLEMERGLIAKYRLEVAGETFKDERITGLGGRAEKLSKICPLIIEGLKLLTDPDDFHVPLILLNRKAKEAFEGYQKK